MFNTKRSKQVYCIKRALKVISIVFVLTILLLGYYFLNSKYKIGIPCLFYKITGYKCPGCGITRALFSLIDGDIKKAFSYNKIIFIVIPFIIIFYIYKSYLYIFNKKENPKIKIIIKYISIFLLIITILYGIIRNI